MSLPVKRRRDEMKIAQVAPLAEAVPPKLYGGTERVVSWLTEELVAGSRRHAVRQRRFANLCAARRLRAPSGLRLDGHPRPHGDSAVDARSRCGGARSEFDIIHFHVDLLQFPLFQRPRAQMPDDAARPARPAGLHAGLPRVSADAAGLDLATTSAGPMPPPSNWLATVHHGLPASGFPFERARRRYLAFLGRISPEKRPDRAIEIAKRAGVPLKIAAKVDPADQRLFRRR